MLGTVEWKNDIDELADEDNDGTLSRTIETSENVYYYFYAKPIKVRITNTNTTKENKTMGTDIKETGTTSFINDNEKMKDFLLLSKKDFLNSYSYINEESYDLTKVQYDSMSESKKDDLAKEIGIRKIYIVSEQEDNEKVVKKAYRAFNDARKYLFQSVGEYISNNDYIYDVHRNEYNKDSFLDMEIEFEDGSSTWFTIEEVVLE